MSRPNTKPTPERITRHDWWWRNPQPGLTMDERGRFRAVPGDAHGHVWKDGNEAAVYSYELCRRLDRSLPKWAELPARAVVEIIQRFSERTSITTAEYGGKFATIITPRSGGGIQVTGTVEDKGHCIVVTPSGQDKPGYTDFIRFNLNATKSALRKCFEDFIAEERKTKAVKPAKLPRKNAISWRRLEVWDLNETDGIPLDTSESSMKSTAKGEAKKVLPLMRSAIKRSEKVKNLS